MLSDLCGWGKALSRMVAAEALVLCWLYTARRRCSGDTAALLACDVCPSAARHTTVYETVSMARSSGIELISGEFTGGWKVT